MMNRRGFLALLWQAPIVAKLASIIPNPKAAVGKWEITHRGIQPITYWEGSDWAGADSAYRVEMKYTHPTPIDPKDPYKVQIIEAWCEIDSKLIETYPAEERAKLISREIEVFVKCMKMKPKSHGIAA